ncbi:BTAD domain-containing putative transcriptional regulator [Actinoplanes sp. NPDC023714]|uniref:AfsR/SARP family transcriptional regulator n=1 Tax=Actinoplanes sp. NPDC023714 TaxID=3154322 RepID=UPI0033DC1973
MEFRVLGEVQVESDGRAVPLGGARQAAVLAILLLEADRPVSPAEIADRLWPDDPPRDRGAVQVYVSRLRRTLKAANAQRYGARIATTPGGYRLELGDAHLDARRFRDLLGAAQDAGRCEEVAELLRRALAVWRGPALAGLPDHLRSLAADLEEARLVAFEDLMAAELDAGRHAEVIGPLTDAVQRHPTREPTHALLMDALYRLGRWADALARYESIRRRLADELGVDPGPDLRRRYAEILHADAATPPSAAPAARPPRPAELPLGTPGFTGRSAELFRLDAVPGRPTPIVVITGAGGVGKTALAVHWAQRVADRFPDGQLYVDLHGCSTIRPLPPVEALARFLRALSVPAARIPADVDEAAATYRSVLSHRRVLVLLDNAAGADQVRPLLAGGTGSLTVITSRNRLTGLLARDGAQRLDLDVLTESEAVALLATIIGAKRVRDDPCAAASFVDACGRLPLALRVGATKLAERPDSGIAGFTAALHGARSLDLLGVEGDSLASVRATFDLSYSALPAPARRLFRLLGLLPSPDVSVDAAAALAALPREEAAALLTSLTQASLVESAGGQRYAQHDLLRQYSADLAARDDAPAGREAAIRRLADWYLHSADAAARELYPQRLRLPVQAAERPPTTARFDGHADALAWFDTERTGLVAMIRQAAERGLRTTAVLLADTVRGYFGLRLPIVEWHTAATTALDAARADGDVRGAGAAEMSLAELDLRQSRYAEAIRHYCRAVDRFRAAGWPDGESAAAGNLGSVYWETGQLERSADVLRRALVIDRRLGRRDLEAMKLGSLGLVSFEMGRLAEAADHQAAAAAIDRELDAVANEATDLLNLGEARHALGRFADAERDLERALLLCRETGNRGSETETLRVLAELHADRGDLGRAAELARSAVALARDTDNVRFVVHAVNTLAGVLARAGEHLDAAVHHRGALHLARRHGVGTAEANALIGLGSAAGRLGRPDQAWQRLRRAVRLCRTAGYRVLEGRARTAGADLLRACGHRDRACWHAEQALTLHRECGHRLGEAYALSVLGGLGDRPHRPSARDYRRAAAGLFAELGAAATADLWYVLATPTSSPPPRPPGTAC